MGLLCQLRQLSGDYAQYLLQNPDEVLQYVDKADEGRLPTKAQGEDLFLDKAWHGFHYLLTGTDWEGEEPYSYILFGGEQVGDTEEHDVGYGPARILLPGQAAAFSTAVSELTPEEIRRRFNAAEMTALNIYPEVWDRGDQDAQESFEFLEESATELQAFLKRAVSNQMAVIVYLF